MSTAPATAASQHDELPRVSVMSNRLRFALVLLIPKLLHLRRNPQSWMALRVFLGFAGAALVVLPLSLWNSWLAAPAGLVMFLAAILLPPANPHEFSNEKVSRTRRPGRRKRRKISPRQRRFRARPTLCRRSANLRARFSFRAAPRHSRRGNYLGARAPNQKPLVLQVRWSQSVAEFTYEGVFAEHLARVAESTLSSVMRSPLPVLPKSRAASA